MNLRPGLLLAALLLCSCVTPSPPAMEIPEAKVLPLSIDEDFQFRKTRRFINQPEIFETTRNPLINFERSRVNYGAFTLEEQKQREGTYFDFYWRSKRPADITVRFEYRQAKLGNDVRAQETFVPQARGTMKTSFNVIGDSYLWDGPVVAWRCLLIENNRIVGFTQSYLWKQDPPGFDSARFRRLIETIVSAGSSVQVGLAGPSVWVRVIGRGSFQNSSGLKEFASEMMRRGHREFIVDLKDCELMDSTFMGTLAGIALKLGREGTLRVVRANPRNRQVLGNLGLDRIFSVEEQPTTAAPDQELRETGGGNPKEAKREAIIEAHENLVAANPANAVRFKDVIDFLKHKEPES